MHRGTAVIEMARASGLTLVGGAINNDAMAASTIGTGELIDMALDAGAKKIIVCLGGSATTDGGYGAVRAIHAPHRLRGVKLLVACDVRTRFVDAAEVFGPQKGASPAQVKLLTGRLQRLAQIYQHDYGVDVREIDGTGAAGGIAGALVALGGQLLPGFDLVADELDLHDAIAAADVVDHRRGLPRRAELRGQGGRRRAGTGSRRGQAGGRGRRRRSARGGGAHRPRQPGR